MGRIPPKAPLTGQFIAFSNRSEYMLLHKVPDKEIYREWLELNCPIIENEKILDIIIEQHTLENYEQKIRNYR